MVGLWWLRLRRRIGVLFGQPVEPTGLNYLNNRYQDPTTGVFISVDPLVGQTGHPYDYANNNPVGLSDLSGLCATDSYSGAACYAAQYGSRPEASAHDSFISRLWSTWYQALSDVSFMVDRSKSLPDTTGYHLWYVQNNPESAKHDEATRSFMDSGAKKVAGITSIGNGILLFPEEELRLPEPGRPNRTGDFDTEIVGNSGWKRSLVDDPSPARHLMGWAALSYEYGYGQATAGLRIAEGDASRRGASQQDYDSGVVGVNFGSRLRDGSISVPEFIVGLDEAAGDVGQSDFVPQPALPNFPGMGRRGYTCYAFGWC